MAEESSGKKKRLHPVARVGIGCGILILLVVVGFVVLGAMGVSFVRQKAGEFEKAYVEEQKKWAEATMAAGGGGLEILPQWFELPDGLSGLRTVEHTEEDDKISGKVVAESSLQPVVVGEALAEKLKAAGFQQRRKVETEQVVTYEFDRTGGRQAVTITITAGTGGAAIEIEYQEQR